MLTVIDRVSETLKHSLTTFVESGLKCNPDELSGNSVSEVTEALVQSLNEAGKIGLKTYIERFEALDDAIERDGRSFRITKVNRARKAF